VGKRMNIKDIPADYAEFERFSQEYERRHYTFAECNQRVGTATREMFVRWLPRPFAPLVRSAIHGLLDDPLREAFGFPKPSRLMRWLVPASLRLRARALRWLPRRKRPVLRTELKRGLYPAGHVIEDLGPPAGTSFDLNPPDMLR
jgi:uncharacterized protein (DUF2236 family)